LEFPALYGTDSCLIYYSKPNKIVQTQKNENQFMRSRSSKERESFFQFFFSFVILSFFFPTLFNNRRQPERDKATNEKEKEMKENKDCKEEREEQNRSRKRKRKGRERRGRVQENQ
jgi:hypothetical protein